MQAVPLYTTAEKEDYLFNAHTECTSLKEDNKYYVEEYNEIYGKFKDLYKLLAEKYNYTVNSAFERDSVKFTDEEIYSLGNASLYQVLHSELKMKLMSYAILTDIKQHFTKATTIHNKLKMAYFQISDAHILALIKLLDIDIPKSVPFGSSFIFELSEGDKYEVKVLYNGELTKLNGKEVLDYESFIKLISSKMFRVWKSL